jgi:hypothetical protein
VSFGREVIVVEASGDRHDILKTSRIIEESKYSKIKESKKREGV